MEQEKLKRLKEILTDLGSLAVGFSGGVDSTFLLSAAAEVLKDRVIAVTIADPVVPRREVEEAEAFCRERGIRQIVTKTDTMAEDSFRKNPPDRCYHCKRRLFTEVIRIAKENGIRYVAEASNIDDLGDYVEANDDRILPFLTSVFVVLPDGNGGFVYGASTTLDTLDEPKPFMAPKKL